MNTLDILIILGLAFAVFKGYRKGMLASFFKLLGYLMGGLTGFLFSEVLAKVLDRSFGLVEKMTPWLGRNASLPASISSAKIEDIPFDKAQGLVAELPMPETFQNAFLEYLSDIATLPEKGITNLGDGLMYLLGNFLLMSICFMVLYFVVSHFLAVTIPKWFKKASPGPVSFLDHLGGAGLGLLSGLISMAITVGMMIPLAAAGAIQGPEQRGVLAKVSLLFNESVLASKISDIVIAFIS